MPQRLQPCQILDPGRSLREKASYVNSIRDEEFWEKFHRKHKQVFGEVKEKIKLEAWNVEEEPKIEMCTDDEGVRNSTPQDYSHKNKDLPLKRPKSRNRGDTDNLWKHIWRSRKLVSAVKQGSSYFQLLQEEEEQKNEKRRKKEERRRTDLQHRSSISDSENEEERRSVNGGVSSSPLRQNNRRRAQQLRPFTPVHQSLTSDQPQELSEEHVYRQLCCLCWLLEALTLERSGRIGSVASCWDAKDPGRSRNTLKVVSREKLIQAKWERFISPPKVDCLTSPLSPHKPPALNATSSSVLTTSLLGNMSSCDVTFSGEESACRVSLLQSETDPLFLNVGRVCVYLQKLIDEVHQSVSKELYGSTTECSSDTDMISFEKLRAQYNTQDRQSHWETGPREGGAMLKEMKLMFKDRAQELSLRLMDTLDLQAKKRWMSGVQRYQSLSNMSASRCHTSSGAFHPELSALLGSLPTHKHLNRKDGVCVWEKLKRLHPGENSAHPTTRLPQVRENAVRMSTDEYDSWLCGKVDLPQSVKTIR
ncbi:hypothetical protein Q7C36_010220 [Tachysurus vachellii]|uniref:Uncharacterized protein n=1 Tax=Tachysurus vachellii TaxID=175792 RepID=A0AA88MXV6_TACVA|nr:hypothetical protein Q7C36_010220 [Tachysurus vachellii]